MVAKIFRVIYEEKLFGSPLSSGQQISWWELQMILFYSSGDKGEGEKEGEASGGKSRQKVKKKRSFKKSFQGIMHRKSKSDKDDDEKK